MSREIKFRALSMCSGEGWVYGDLRHYNRNPRTEKWTIHDPQTGLETDIDEDTIGEFTCLHDKNGKEIYEGDIIRHVVGRMKNSKGIFVDETKTFAVEYDRASFNISSLSLVTDYIEVIGNIYET